MSQLDFTGFKVYSMKNCPYCDATMALLTKTGYSFEVIPSQKNSEWPTMPRIYAVGTDMEYLIGGYRELVNLLVVSA